MAKPQIENGHIDIANELAEALCQINLSAYESRILWALWRKTYGWHKKADHISYTQWEKLTGLKRWHIARTIKRLIERNIVTCRGNGYHLEYGFQEDYEQWVITISGRCHSLPKGVTKIPLPIGVGSLPKGVTKPLPKGVNTKENKETIQKKIYKRKYGEFQNVLLSDEEYHKLKEKFGETECQRMIETLSSGMKAKKKYKYSSHYAAILNWKRREEREKGGQDGTHRGHIGTRQLPTKYRTPEEIFGTRDGGE